MSIHPRIENGEKKMSYSKIVILAAIIHCIVNRDIIGLNSRDAERIPAFKEYRGFLLAVMFFFVVDGFWGVLNSHGWRILLYFDTVAYFVAMALSVLQWTKYTITYLEENDLFAKVLMASGRVFFVFEMIILAANFFAPIMFSLDGRGEYHALFFRYITFGLQFLLFLLTAAYAFYIGEKTQGVTRRRHKVIGVFGIAMTGFITIQLYYPYEAIYAAGYAIGSCLLHTFIVEEVQKEYRLELEDSLEREKQQSQALAAAMNLAYTDSLTGVKSKHAYVETEIEIDASIAQMNANDFAVAVCDLNGLKQINDTYGHDAGDKYIIAASRLIAGCFSNSVIYRIGGDEFTVIVEGEDYARRKELAESFMRQMENAKDGVVIAMGMADYRRGQDNTFRSIFKRADSEMYARKLVLKKHFSAKGAFKA